MQKKIQISRDYIKINNNSNLIFGEEFLICMDLVSNKNEKEKKVMSYFKDFCLYQIHSL
jgi:hypothetical protein